MPTVNTYALAICLSLLTSTTVASAQCMSELGAMAERVQAEAVTAHAVVERPTEFGTDPQQDDLVERRGYRRTVTIVSGSTQLTLDLEPTSVIAAECTVNVLTGDEVTQEPCPHDLYEGTVRGQPESIVVASIDESGLHAQIFTSENSYAVSPADDGGHQSGWNTAHEIEIRPRGPLPLAQQPVASGVSTTAGGLGQGGRMITGRLKVAPLTMVADWRATGLAGGIANIVSQMASTVVAASFMYTKNINLQLRIDSMWIFNIADPAPFSINDDMDDRLEHLEEWVAAQLPNASQTPMAFMFTGQPEEGTKGATKHEAYCVGIRAAVIHRFGGALADFNTILVAHELGHAFGQCAHDGRADCPNPIVPDECVNMPTTGFLMMRGPEYVPDAVLPLEDFSPCSVEEITEYFSGGEGTVCAFRAICGDYVTDYPRADADRVNVLDVLATLHMSVGNLPTNKILDVASPFGSITTSDALTILHVAVGLLPIPVRCG